MDYEITILRHKKGSDRSYYQTFAYTSEGNENIAAVLDRINRPSMTDIGGEPAEPVRWECSCLQKKCGACAMVINGIPCLACDRKISDCPAKFTIEPLRKFPVVEDLIVDRSSMMDELRSLNVWLSGEARSSDDNMTCYEASVCLQCGCCLEVCPNFCTGGEFAGMSAAVPMTRLLLEMDNKQGKELASSYVRNIFEGCGKSLACRDICPAGIDIDKMLINSNAVAVWRRNKHKVVKK